MSRQDDLFNSVPTYRHAILYALFPTGLIGANRAYFVLSVLDFEAWSWNKWLPDVWRNHELNILRNAYHYNYEQKMKDFDMSTKTWVLNNLTDEQMQRLDDEYPSPEGLDFVISEAINSGISFSMTYDYKSKTYVTYANQDEYACSGRSDTAYDSLVICAYKTQISDYELSKSANASLPRKRRG